MTSHVNPSGYGKLKQIWVKQHKYTLATEKNTTENFGAFSISAAVRPSNCANCNKQWANPWDRQPMVYGVS